MEAPGIRSIAEEVNEMPKPLRVVLTFAVGCAIFVGLPLAAWGFGDVRGFVGDPALSLIHI